MPEAANSRQQRFAIAREFGISRETLESFWSIALLMKEVQNELTNGFFTVDLSTDTHQLQLPAYLVSTVNLNLGKSRQA